MLVLLGERRGKFGPFNLHLKRFQYVLDPGAVQLYADTESINAGLDKHIPFNIAQRAISRGAVPLVVVQDLLALAQRGLEVADYVQQRGGVPPYLARVSDAMAL